MQSHLDWAAIAILFAIPFDALDGRIARMTNTCSDFGKELDSLADVITFGVAPSLLAFVWGFHFLPDSTNPELQQHLMQAGAFICFLFLLSGLRGWRGSISLTMRSHGILDGRGASILWACRFRRRRDCLRPRFICSTEYPVPAWWVAIPWLLMVALCRVPDDEHLAVLVGQGDQFFAQPSVPGAGAGGDRDVHDDPLLERCDVWDWAYVYVLRHLGQGGVRVVAAAAAKADRDARVPGRMPAGRRPEKRDSLRYL